MSENNEAKKKIEKLPVNFNMGRAINLIPELTEDEIQVETTKVSLNINAAFALLFLIVFSIFIVGFNLVSKLSLNQKKEALISLEQEVRGQSTILSSNDEILRRVYLYKDIEESTFSSKAVFDYWDTVSVGLGSITNIELTNGMNFIVSGDASTLGDVSQLWYLLGNDDKVESVSLKTVSKDGSNVRFNFEGKLNFSAFAKDGGA